MSEGSIAFTVNLVVETRRHYVIEIDAATDPKDAYRKALDIYCGWTPEERIEKKDDEDDLPVEGKVYDDDREQEFEFNSRDDDNDDPFDAEESETQDYSNERE